MNKVLLFTLAVGLTAALGSEARAASPEPMFLLEEEEDFAGAGDFLCQKALGLKFVLPPPGFKANKAAQEKLVHTLREPGPSAFGWVWLNEEKGQLIVVEMVKGPTTAEDFLFFAHKVEESFGKATSFEVEKRDAKTSRAPFRYELASTLGPEKAFDIECVSTPAKHRDPSVACIVTFAPNHADLEKVRDSLTFGECP